MDVDSQLEAVTVYASGAVCTRRAKAAAPAQPTRQLRITGLPLSLRPTSLRAMVLPGSSGLRVLDVRAGFDVQLAEELDVPAEQKALEHAEAELGRLEQALARLVLEAKELGGLRSVFPAQKKGEPPRSAPIEAMLQLADFVDRELASRSTQTRLLEPQVTDARNEVELRRRRLAEASSARRTERARLSRSAVLLLSAEQTGPLELALEYQVPGARWVPNYELRLEPAMSGGSLKLRASVAQNSGEDWRQVRLSLSTAQLDRRTDLPELRALKIGRSQPPAPRSGWREPPPGLDELFAGLDEALANRPPGVRGGAASVGPPPRSAKEQRAKRAAPPPPPTGLAAGGAPPAPGNLPMPPPMAAPAPLSEARASMPARAPSSPAGLSRERARGGVGRQRSHEDEDEEAFAEGEAGAVMDEALAADEPYDGEGKSEELAIPAPVPAIVPEEGLLDYDRLTMPGPEDSARARGRLQPAPEWELAFATAIRVEVSVITVAMTRAHQVAAQVDRLPLPAHAAAVRASAAAFDYRYDCESPVDVPSTGKWALVPVTTAQVGLAAGYSCVPAVEPKVYRVLEVSNRSAHALLQGPVDVSVGDQFLMTTQLPTVAPRGEQARLGLGVEEALKVARKTHFKETTGGLLGGSTVLPHEIEIEVSNRLPFAAAIEIRERIPVSQDPDVKIEETQVKPAWEKDEQLRDGVQTEGARRWRLNVAPGEKAAVSAQFSIKIPGDKMLVGGNRRV